MCKQQNEDKKWLKKTKKESSFYLQFMKNFMEKKKSLFDFSFNTFHMSKIKIRPTFY